MQTLHSCRVVKAIYNVYQPANQPRENGTKTFGCVFDMPISDILAEKFSDFFFCSIFLYLQEALQHPVVRMLIKTKWQSYGHWFLW